MATRCTRSALANRQHFSAPRRKSDGIDARILFRTPALEETARNETADQLGSSRAVDPGSRHDGGLTEAIDVGDCLQDGELTRREDVVADVMGE